MKSLIAISLLLLAIVMLQPVFAADSDTLQQPTKYLLTKLQQNDIVFLGTRHRRPKILGFIAELIPSLKGLGVTHIGLEIPSGQQDKIDAYMQTGDGLSEILFHPLIDCPEYRHLFEVLRKSGSPIPVAIDLPYTKRGGSISRDEWMARSLISLPLGKVLVIVGNQHIFKKLEWDEHVPNKHFSIRQYIQRKQPKTNMCSVGQVIDEDPEECDFTAVFSNLPGAVALNLDDNKVLGWKMGLTAPIAIMPAECFELVDGLIVY